MGTTTHYRDPNRGFRIFNRSEIVTVNGNGQWVPNIGDLVFDVQQGFFTVISVDQTTGLSELRPWSPPINPENDPTQDLLLGAGPGYPSESYRIFLDTSVTPFTFSPDARLRFYGSMVHAYKVFRGSDISSTHGKVLSMFYDPSGNFLGNAVPVEVVEVPGAVQQVIKTPSPGYTNRQLADGELVTLVAYDNEGGVVSIAQLIVQNTTAIRRVNDQRKYVQGISIESAFLSTADPQVIEFPVNVTVESLPITGLVHYSDGSRQRIGIDGNRFALHGMNNYISSIVGQQFPLVLTYRLAEDEVSYGESPTVNDTISSTYTAKTTAADGAYTVKLFVYPVWVNSQVGYRLEYWLYNLDRQTYYNATPYVELATNSAPFNPTYYGVTQTFTVAVDLNRVDGSFMPYRHVQRVQLALLTRGDDRDANWSVFFTPDQETQYGANLFADLELLTVNNWRLRLGNGFPSKELWLENLFYHTEPLYNEQIETIAPEPTHVRVQFLYNTYEYSVDQWNDVLTVNNDLADGELVYLQWIRRTADTDLQLGMSALPARRRES